MQNGKITPANIAEAIGFGMALTVRPRAGQRPVRAKSRPVTKNAPTAFAKPSPRLADETKIAAPGVLQTMEIGIRKRQESKIESPP